MASPWLRLYRSALNSPKVQKLGLEGVGFWANCLMAADDDGYLPDGLSWVMRLPEEVVTKWLGILECHGLVTRDGHGNGHDTRYRMHDWEHHQHQSDTDPTAAERKRRQRQKAQETANRVTENVTRDGHGNVTRTDTDTDKNREEKKAEAREQVRDDPATFPPDPQPASRPKEPQRGTRWPPDAVVPDDWLVEGEAYRENARIPPLDLRAEALKFANYWASKSGGSATKIDWKRTWLNWCLTAKGNSHAARKSQLEQLAEIIHSDTLNG